MDHLAKHIEERLTDRNFCIIFETELGRVFPVNQKERGQRFAAIAAFAEARGFTAHIHDPGVRVTFKKKKPDVERKKPRKKSPEA